MSFVDGFFSSGAFEQLNLSQEVLGLSQKATKGKVEISIHGVFRDLSSGRSCELVAGSEFAPLGLCVPLSLFLKLRGESLPAEKGGWDA